MAILTIQNIHNLTIMRIYHFKKGSNKTTQQLTPPQTNLPNSTLLHPHSYKNIPPGPKPSISSAN